MWQIYDSYSFLFFLFFSCNEAGIQAEDVFNQRIETLALNLDKICDEKRVWRSKTRTTVVRAT
ncbi:hypothetical protein Hanom_Chr14g01293891 [Helianthus anomalus]